MKRKGYTIPGASDSVLQDLWRKAVRAKWNHACALAGATSPDYSVDPCQGALECHHYIKRSRPHLKHDVRNGVLLCQYHHPMAGQGFWRRKIEVLMGENLDAVYDLERKLFPDYLRERGMSRREYLLSVKETLLKCIAKTQDNEPA
jgi:predicted restriction endonuclease